MLMKMINLSAPCEMTKSELVTSEVEMHFAIKRFKAGAKLFSHPWPLDSDVGLTSDLEMMEVKAYQHTTTKKITHD